MEATRIDQWLWSVRVCSTRVEATEVCRAGHVTINGHPAKASSKVAVGQRIAARVHGRDRVLEVVKVIDKRVGAKIAVECYVDHSPPPAEHEGPMAVFGQRDRGAGKITKKDRRDIERWLRSSH